MEHNFENGPLATKQNGGVSPPVSIAVHSYRVRLCDPDGISAKAIIDGIVHSGLLPDDSPEFVTSVTFEQTKVKNYDEEKTIITLTEVR